MARKIWKNGRNTKQTGVWTDQHGYITEKGLRFLAHRNPHWALKAVVELFDRQTQDEKDTRTTRWDNERGFRADDASRGAKLAKRILAAVKAHGSFKGAVANLDRADVDFALFLVHRYRKQVLNIIARAESARKGA